MVTATTLLPAAPRATITPAVVVTATPHRHTPRPHASTSEAHISATVAIIILALADITSTAGNVTGIRRILVTPVPPLAGVHMVECIVVDIAIITRRLHRIVRSNRTIQTYSILGTTF